MMRPPARPRLTREEGEGLLSGAAFASSPSFASLGAVKVRLLGVRGYYRDTMGAKGKNDRGIYDDAICLVTPDAYGTFNANTDPSVTRRGVAVLRTGTWLYKIGMHGLSKPRHPSGALDWVENGYQYRALVQAGPVTVMRDGVGADTGWFGINIHRGSYSTTSSLGCQTIWPDQWSEFIGMVRGALKGAGQSVVPYVLMDGPVR